MLEVKAIDTYRGPAHILHGVSLNVGLDVSGFDCIVPCGSAGERITSIAAERSPAPAADEVATRLAATIAGRLQAHARGKGIISA